MSNKREMMTASAIQYALEWLENNPVKIDLLVSSIRAKLDDWDPEKRVPRAVRDTVVKTAADRAVRRHIEKTRSNSPRWKTG